MAGIEGAIGYGKRQGGGSRARGLPSVGAGVKFRGLQRRFRWGEFAISLEEQEQRFHWTTGFVFVGGASASTLLNHDSSASHHDHVRGSEDAGAERRRLCRYTSLA